MIACTPALEITNVSCDSKRSLSITPTCSATSTRPLVLGCCFSASSMASGDGGDSGAGGAGGGGGGGGGGGISVRGGGGGAISLGALSASGGENSERTKPSSSSRIVGVRDAASTCWSLSIQAPDRGESIRRTRGPRPHLARYCRWKRCSPDVPSSFVTVPRSTVRDV